MASGKYPKRYEPKQKDLPQWLHNLAQLHTFEWMKAGGSPTYQYVMVCMRCGTSQGSIRHPDESARTLESYIEMVNRAVGLHKCPPPVGFQRL